MNIPVHVAAPSLLSIDSNIIVYEKRAICAGLPPHGSKIRGNRDGQWQ